MISPTWVSEGWRIFKRARNVHSKGFNQYTGDVKAICRQIVLDCYNHDKEYFMTSTGHYCQFWTRDFGMCTQSLLDLGYENQVLNTLKYALKCFEHAGKITTCLTPKGKAFDFPTYSPESLAYLLRSLSLADAEDLVREHKDFLNDQLQKATKYIDPQTGLLRKDVHVSSIKDHAVRKSDCYTNCMLSMLSHYATKLGLENPLKKYDYANTIQSHFWTGTHFLEDLSGHDSVTGDANTFPFWTGLFQDPKLFQTMFDTLRKTGLDRPFPLKYTDGHAKHKMIPIQMLTKEYEHTAIFMHLGLCFLQVVKKYDLNYAQVYLKKYTELIQRHKNFLEVFDAQGQPYKTALHVTDEGMLWAAMYLDLMD